MGRCFHARNMGNGPSAKGRMRTNMGIGPSRSRLSRFALPRATPATCRPRSPPPPHAGALLRSSNRRRKMIVGRSAFLCCTLIVISVISFVGADSIRGCGGFVEATSQLIKSRKPSDGKLDYSHITVELQTVDGLVKDRTQCAPNGYYFIPVYDKGSFVIKIKGPEGWSWDPDSVPIVIDQSGCNSNADINFRLTGFTISGKVLGAVGGESCSLKGAGPSGVKIELLSPSEGVISSVMTTSSGEYSFINVIPGSYCLRASHPNLKIEITGSEEVVLGFGNVILDDIFFVPGYDVQGFVVAQGNPILGVHLYLYSDDVHKVNCPQGPVHDPWQKSSLCHAVSDADGKFMFNTVPCGSYKLVSYYKGENTVFDVSPSSVNVSVAHQHVTVLQKFQVTGFSIGGRVIDGNADGVDAVEIIVDGHVRSVTDSLGYYKLDQVTSGHYTISAKKNHYRFKSLEKFMVLPNMVSVPDIEAASYDICGVVHSISSGQKAKVALTHGPDNVKPQIKQTDEDGYFCFEVPAGEYRLSALAANPESASGLVFLPPFVDITVNSPLLNVEFSQAQVDIHGTVVCKDACGSSVHVSLSRLLNDGKQEQKTIDLSHENSDFVFAKVLPGKYRLEVKHGPLSTEDTWCWEHSAIDVDVGAEDVKGIVFIQKGYWINIDSTHEVDVAISKSGVLALTLPIKKGSQRVCIESSGKHELHFVNSCILFESSPVIFDTLHNSSIYLKGDKYLLKGEIHIDPASQMEGRELLDNILVDILDRDHRIVGQDIARVILDDNDVTSGAVYKYSYWANLGDELIFVPQDLRNNTDKKFLFYPRTNRVLVNSDGCYATNPPFVGRLGLYIVGSVSPPISDVDIKIFASGNNGNSMLKKDDLALETITGKDGFFNGGPLYDDVDYYVAASKHGYYLKPEGPYTFSCQKLSQISVTIHSREDSENLFPSVLLSLSGEDGYRNNSVTGTGGSFIFDSLFPGSFYLRPLLKEYSFSPAAQAIELGSGESTDIFFEATRVAYSAMGSVSLLSGQPKEDVSVEARSESSGYYEETVTDSSGNYRLRGLLPDTTYLVRVVDKESCKGTKIERASPEFVHIKASSEDIRGLDFVVFEEPELTILSGHVEGNDLEKLQPHLTVEVRMASDPSKTLSVSPLPLSYYFQLRDLPKGRHLVQLRLALSSVAYKFESEAIEVDLEKRSQIHVGPLKYTVEELRQKVELTPAPVFPLIAGVAAIALFIFMPRLKDVYHLAVGMTPFNTASNMKKETRKAIPKRRTY